VPGGFEAVGDALTGAVIARAVEPGHGEATGGAHGTCLNCAAALTGPYCSQCGQSAHAHRTLAAYGHDLLHGVFHFEGKIWHTLPLLAWKPGELTRRYVRGERAKFVSPLALFLFAVFLTFAVVGGLAGEMHAPDAGEVQAQLKGKPLTELEAAQKAQKAKMEAIDTAIRRLESTDGDTAILEKQRDAVEKEIDDIGTAKHILKGEKWTVAEGKTGWLRLDKIIDKANKNPDLLLYKLQSSAYKYSWALIPLSTPFVWLMFFWRREYKLYDHAVFVTYSLTFMMFLVVVLTVLGFIGSPEPVVPIAGTFVPPLHLYRQLRGAYGVSRLGGIVRTLALSVFGAMALILFVVLLLGLGVMG
jgi:Protein of unknown function (DUF3667)